MIDYRWRQSLVLAFCVFGSTGCSGSAKVDGPAKNDIALVNGLVSQIPDASSRPTSLKSLFAKDGTVPSEADRKRIVKLQFQVIGTPTIKEDTATAEVEVRNSASGDSLGKVQWTLVKENEQWKLKTAPLP